MAVIYPVRRAIEHAVATPGVQPLRVFAVLWPLWQVEITAQVEEPQSYDLLDTFVTRAVGEAGIDHATGIADLLGLPPLTIHGCVRYLVTIQHLTVSGDRLALTDRGRRSLHEGKRYVSKESRQQLLFDRYTADGLPRSHYEGAVTILHRPEVTRDETWDGTRFVPLFARTAFRAEIVDELVRRPDRTDYNVPAELTGVRIVEHRDAFLPVYLVQTVTGLLAYSAAGNGRDAAVEALCRRAPEVTRCLPTTAVDGARDIWTDWLREQHGGRGRLHRAANGVWRAVLPADAFGAARPRTPLSLLCSYEVRGDMFLQLWCEDRALRRDALLDRALRILRTPEINSLAALTRRLRELAQRYEVDPVTVDQLREYGTRTGQHQRLRRLDGLS